MLFNTVFIYIKVRSKHTNNNNQQWEE